MGVLNETTTLEAKKNQFLDYSRKNYEVFPEKIKSKIDIQELYFKHNCVKQLPSWISKLINLTDLSLYDNCLIDLPEEIGLLINLKCLDVGRNCLKTIPKSLKGLQNLNFLAAENNFLIEIPEEIGYLKNLIVLQLSNNRLEKLPLSLVFCKSLYALHLERNNLYKLPNNLALLPNIEFITVCTNQLLYLPSLPFARKLHFDFSQNSYVNYVSHSFYEQQFSCNVCDRLFCHKNHENIMAFRKDIKIYDIGHLPNIVLQVKIDNQIKFIILNDGYKNVYKMEEEFSPSLLELALRTTFETASIKDLFSLYYFAENNTKPIIPIELINILVKGPVAKCQTCRSFIFTESIIWVVPKLIHCVICIKMDVPVITVINFCSTACAYLFHLIESSTGTEDNLSALKLPWHKIN